MDKEQRDGLDWTGFQVKVKNLHIELNNSENEDTNDELWMDTDIDEDEWLKS